MIQLFRLKVEPRKVFFASKENEECTNPIRGVTLFITPYDKLVCSSKCLLAPLSNV